MKALRCRRLIGSTPRPAERRDDIKSQALIRQRTPVSRGSRHGCRQHIGLERIRCGEIRREGYLIRIQNMAEGEGFEPPKACTLVVFKTTAIDHSAIPPAIINDTGAVTRPDYASKREQASVVVARRHPASR